VLNWFIVSSAACETTGAAAVMLPSAAFFKDRGAVPKSRGGAEFCPAFAGVYNIVAVFELGY